MQDLINTILKCQTFAVSGASRDPAKFGNKVYYFLTRRGLEVYAVNPNADCLVEDTCYASLDDLPVKPDCVVTVTQPWVTTGTCKSAARLGIPYVWMQPGSESKDGVAAAEAAGVGVVHGGPCIMVEFNRT
jgi:uncharacterized protein